MEEAPGVPAIGPTGGMALPWLCPPGWPLLGAAEPHMGACNSSPKAAPSPTLATGRYQKLQGGDTLVGEASRAS